MCSHCYGLPLYSFHRFQKRAHFKFWTNQKAAIHSFQLILISCFSVDSISGFWFFNLIGSYFKSTKNLTTINLFPDSGLNFQKIQPDFWFLILLNSISQIYQNQIQVFKSWVLDLGCQIDSINGFQFKLSRFLIPNFCSWTRFKFLIFIQKPPKRKSHLKKPIPFFKMGPVNLKNPNFSFSVRFTVKNTILDRAFTRRFKISIPRFGNQFSISGEIPILSFYFWGGTIHIFNSIECQFWCGTP